MKNTLLNCSAWLSLSISSEFDLKLSMNTKTAKLFNEEPLIPGDLEVKFASEWFEKSFIICL
jgi:hypothetical protein